ncbi:threonine ammonia-lyase (plasmid) [Natrialba magadii ATCC 43099]|uniref:Threonine ammonia-lyase n=1 Tax=Natrialba magadii (strain ATCC 43099 / DSM 3394 / CCM 3739 / CIP 104546 / IAM 13178 / JCM 8861 / NBRC 102185 / NCIMB 2190 / MS3) TaxID=547559 RepID=D3T150_NATMM|nr:threonine/serine dehydratase [Natrialba magadii]ADD07309.1 threonine ammonia-lyase [Natrialba magadii ATCC 43099]ELY32690.1 threonine dehydratase [Natrialba magadii ATCC 43099]
MTDDTKNDDTGLVTRADIEAARERIDDVVHRTPLDTSRTFADLSGAASVGLKLENVQRTGSFKIRGAYNKMAQLSADEREAGVISSSAGNHAQGVALAGQVLDTDTTIVVPDVTPAAKIEATRGYGAEVVVEGDIYERSYEFALERAAETGETFVHPFDDEDIIAGQGTIGLELREQYPDLDTVLVAIGGGGLISGIGTVLKAHDPTTRVIGVQPEGAAHAKPTLESDPGEIHELPDVDTVAEGIADTRLLETTAANVREVVDDVVSVSDRDIVTAVTLLAERAKTVVEGAGAAPLAAALSDAVDVADKHVAVVISGGNVNLTDHAELTRTGLHELGRYAEARLAVDGWPTAVSDVVETVEAEGAELDVLERARRGSGLGTDAVDHPNRVPVTVGLEGSGPDHLVGVLDAIAELDSVDVLSSLPEE